MRTLVVAALVLSAAASVTPVHADTVDELERAEVRLERALRAAADARSDVVRAFADLEAGMQAFTSANTDLERAALAVTSARDAVGDAESDLRRARQLAQRNAVWAYMAGPGPGLIDGFDPTRIQRNALERIVREAFGARLDDLEATVDAEKIRLAADRTALQERQAEERERQETAIAMVADLEVALYRARVAAAAARGEETAAAFGRDAALAAYETEIKKRAALFGVERWRPLIERYFPRDRVDEALQIMACESRGDPEATNPYSTAAGLFQFLEGTWPGAVRGAGFGDADRFDPEANIAAAAWLVQHSIRIDHPQGPWGHWACRTVLTADS